MCRAGLRPSMAWGTNWNSRIASHKKAQDAQKNQHETAAGALRFLCLFVAIRFCKSVTTEDSNSHTISTMKATLSNIAKHLGVRWQSVATTPLLADERFLPKRRGASLPAAVQIVALVTCIVTLIPAALSAATNDLAGMLQRGLFEEEANRNLEAAAQAYQAVGAQFDKDRALAATAIFRLGEIYRKQNKTNEASAQYERIMREFPDQQTLATLSRQNLAGIGAKSEVAVSPALPRAARLEQKRLLDEEIKLVELDLTELRKRADAGIVSQIEVRAKEREVLKLRQQGTALNVDGVETSTAASDVTVTDDEEKEIRSIQEMIRNSPDLINAPSGDPSMTPLCRAAKNGHLRVAKFLLDGSAAIDRRSGEKTPLQYAAASGHRAMTEFLLQRGADPNARGNSGRTALHVAAENGFQAVAEALVAAKADVNPSAAKGETPLLLAAGYGHAELVQFLISKGAELNTPNDVGTTPLMNAASRGHSETVTALIAAKANPNLLDKEGRTALSYAAGIGNLESVKALLAVKADPNAGSMSLPLHAAIHQKSPLVVETLLRADADPNRVANIRWQSAELGTYGFGSRYPALSPLFLAIKESNPEIVKLLLQFKADPNANDPYGVPLIFSVVNQTETLKAFLDAGAKPNVKNANDGTPLSTATSATAVNLLLAAGADIENGQGNRSPLLLVADWGDGKISQEISEALLKGEASVMARDSLGQTPLHRAANVRAPELISLLLSYKADVNARDKNGMTPLDMVTGSREKFWQHIGSTSGDGFDNPARTEKTAALLRQHGGQRDLPKVDRIEVRRPESGYSKTIFIQGTNDWNRFTLLEAIFGNYFSGNVGPRGFESDGQARSFSSRLLLNTGAGAPSFPDLHRVVVVRPNLKAEQAAKRIVVDLILPTGALDCAADIPLEFGDLVEIPEREHTLQEAAIGLTSDQLRQIIQCREGAIELVVRGKRTPMRVEPTSGEAAIGEVLARFEARQALFSSSDLSRVKVTRRDAAGGKPREWVIDCSAGKAPDLWLRDGDVIEVPDKP